MVSPLAIILVKLFYVILSPIAIDNPYIFLFSVWQVLAFRDIAPEAPPHIVIIPKARDGLTGLSKVFFKNLLFRKNYFMTCFLPYTLSTY
jgi:hypothetical protein